MKSIWLAGAAFVSLAVATTTTGDTLDLVHTAIANGFNSQATDDDIPSEPVEESGFYFRGDVGLNLMTNAKINNSNQEFRFDPGVDSAILFGYQFLEWLSIEAQSGLAWNQARDQPANNSLNLFQVPILANVNFIVPISRPGSERWPFIGLTAYLDFNFGMGAQWTRAASKVGGVSQNHDDWAFAYQLGTDLRMGITHNFDMGIYFKFRGTTTVTLQTNAKAKELMNFALGMNFRVSF